MALDAIVNLFRGGEPPEDGRDLAAKLKETYGSNVAASKATGIPESTIRRWGKGATPSRHNVERADRAGREVSAPRVDQAGFAIQTMDRKDGRMRTVNAEKMDLAPGTLDRVRAQVVAGNEAEAKKEFLKGVREPWYRQYLTPGSAVARTGTADGSGGGPSGAISRDVFNGGGDESGDYDDSDLAYEGGGDEAGDEYGGQVTGIIATIINLITGGGRK
jgi:hypothetical protein